MCKICKNHAKIVFFGKDNFFGKVIFPLGHSNLDFFSFFGGVELPQTPTLCVFCKLCLQKTLKYEVSKGHHVLWWRVSYPMGDQRSFQFATEEQIQKLPNGLRSSLRLRRMSKYANRQQSIESRARGKASQIRLAWVWGETP